MLTLRLENSIKFYILVPVYKVEKYIRDCIDSVLSQTYQNFRLVLVDDGSPDNCGKICDEYAENDDRITVIHQNNMGLLAARRTGIGVAKHECSDDSFICFLDSDDSLKPNALEVIKNAIIANMSDLVIYNLSIVVDGIETSQNDMCFVGNVTDKAELYRKVFFNYEYNPLCRKVVSAKLIHDTDYSMYYHISHSEDLLQSIPIYGECKKVSFINDKLYNYNQVTTSITHSVEYRGYKIDSTVRKAVWDFLKSENVWTEKDYKEYLKYCRKLIKNMIRKISDFDVELAKKAELFQEIKEDEYYSMVIASAPKKDIFFKLFSSGNYGAINIFFGLRRKLASLRNLVKR